MSRGGSRTAGTPAPVAAMSAGLAHTRRMLFEPFQPKKWFILGFLIFLSRLGSAGGGGGGPGGGVWSEGGEAPGSLTHALRWAVEHPLLVLAVAALVFLMANVLGAILEYLGARGHFMFLECVIRNQAEVKVPWSNASRPAWSYFLWRLAVFFLLFWTAALLFAMPLWGVLREVAAGKFTIPHSLLPLLLSAAVYFPLLLVVLLADLLVRDFVTPVMALARLDLVGAMERALGLWRGYPLELLVYLGLRLLVSVAGGILAVLVCCLTCCLAALPVVHQTVTAPVHVFLRSWTLAILEDFGPEYRSIGAVAQEGETAPAAGA